MAVNFFDANFYRSTHSDLRGFSEAQAWSHFQTYGLNEGRSFSPFVNLNLYRSSNSDLASFNNQQAFEHLQNYGVAEGRRFSQFVDINYYLTVNPDVNQAFGGNRERTLEHLRDFGINEGRSFSPYIDLNYYLSNNPDVNQAFGGNRNRAFEHLQNFGLDEERKFSPAFDINFYRNSYSDLSNAGLTTNRSLFQHWVTYGAESDKRSGTPDPGNSLDTALSLDSPANSITLFNDFVGSSDSNDYYRFTLNDFRNIGVNLAGLSADLDLALLDVSGNFIASSNSSGSDSVNYIGLNPGTYFIRVNQGISGTSSSNYNPPVCVLPSQEPGNTLVTAYPVSNSVSPLRSMYSVSPFRSVIRDSVGGSDTDDYYRFELTQSSSFEAQLNPFTANADLYLLDYVGATIRSSIAGSTANDLISSTPLSAGIYFVRISGSSDNTGYNLNVNFI